MGDKIVTCLWFENEAEEAANFYTSLFPNSKVTSVSRYGDAGPGEPGSVMTVDFELDGRPFMGLNGGPSDFRFTEAVSIFVNCDSQAEVDELWKTLTDGGEESQCGWLKDRYGLSWQIVPRRLMELMQSGDAAASERVMKAMLEMGKIDVETLEEAAAGS